jgi:transposase
LQVAHFKLSYSRAFILRAYPQQTHEMLFDAHNHAFRVLGGVPRRGIYDNMRTAVDKVGRGKERQVNARFSAMVSHFLFEAGDAGPKGRRKMLGMPPWGVDRLLEIVDSLNVSEEKLRDPLVLLVSSRRVQAR